MEEIDLFARLALALAIGLLFGLERGWQGRAASEGTRSAGIRTFALVGLFGGVTGWLTALTGPVILGLGVIGISALITVSYWVQMAEREDLGLTTEIALLLTYGLGAAAVLGAPAPAAVLAVAATFLLSIKTRLHGWVARIRQLELDALLKLAMLSVAVLPFLPDRGYGPGGVLNPYEIWWAVVIVAGLSFVGYGAVRLAGPRLGVLATGVFGGLASSTSTTVALSRLARQNERLVPVVATGIVLAGSITFLRVLVLASVFEPRLLGPLLWPMGLMAAAGAIAAVMILVLHGRSSPSAVDEDGLNNPLELTAALVFGGVLVLVILLTHYLKQWYGADGVYVAAAVSGLTDVDAMTVSVARLVGTDFAPATGATAIVITAIVNTVVKGGLSYAAGTTGVAVRVLAAYALVVAAAAAALSL
ncbi:MgtC/SapB family protein [Roseovarius salis]|uniref:MgtC/SapB family protein n=1 Tax=Roseovarius salis TaxID=3376063 RepID=UPI0037CCC275